VRLLFDENLSARLVEAVADVYPGSAHVLAAGLGGAPDERVWEHAGTGGFVLVTKDEDFHRLSVLRGPPPKVIWIRLGNCATADVVRLLRVRAEQIARFIEHEDAAFLALG
jgi:predicted nuclease of predicted toxin-antitoxin system